MANEVRVQTSLQIRKNNLTYMGQPTSFTADIVGTEKGPAPGAMTATIYGTNVDLSQLTTPGFCRIQNLDTVNYVEVGIHEVESNIFYPMLEVGPGESYVVKLSRNIQEQYAGTGTGTTAPTNQLRIKANGASCNVIVEAFEK